MLTASAPPHAAPDAPFNVAVHRNHSQVVVAPAGELEMATVAQVEHELTELRHAGFTDVLLDLRAVTFIDSSGLNLLLCQHRAARANGNRFRLIGGSGPSRRLFELTGTTDEFDFVAVS